MPCLKLHLKYNISIVFRLYKDVGEELSLTVKTRTYYTSCGGMLPPPQLNLYSQSNSLNGQTDMPCGPPGVTAWPGDHPAHPAGYATETKEKLLYETAQVNKADGT
uniref:Uncharacterized protein n=1 Tax=Sphaerodactylus townsendi TaxID=933632 RepID=A0ACB8FT78_9SAUR